MYTSILIPNKIVRNAENNIFLNLKVNKIKKKKKLKIY